MGVRTRVSIAVDSHSEFIYVGLFSEIYVRWMLDTDLFISYICMCDENCKIFFFLVTMNITEKWKRNHRLFVLECLALSPRLFKCED